MTQPPRRLTDLPPMASQRRRNGRPADLTVRILRQIRDTVRDLGERIDLLRIETGARFEVVEERLGSLEHATTSLERATASGFRQVTARIENLRDVAGERWRDHERRLRALETSSRRSRG